MANDITLQEGHPLDENLRPVKVGGKTSALEISDRAVKVHNLEVNGTTSGISVSDDTKLPLAGGTMTGDIAVADGFTLDGAGDVNLDADGGDIHFKKDGDSTMIFDVGSSHAIRVNASPTNTDDSFALSADSNGSLHISTVDAAGSNADVWINADGDISFDSHTGVFIAKKAGTEFSPANSAYAGMILGFTEIFDDSISGEDTFQTTTTSFVNLSLTQGGGEKYLKVAFVVPPSNKVLIKVHLGYCANCDGTLELGLATDDSATTLHEDYERRVWDVDETDAVGIYYQWVVHG